MKSLLAIFVFAYSWSFGRCVASFLALEGLDSDAGHVYISTGNGVAPAVHKVSVATGERKWTSGLPGKPQLMRATKSGLLVVAGGMLHMIRFDDGSAAWNEDAQVADLAVQTDGFLELTHRGVSSRALSGDVRWTVHDQDERFIQVAESNGEVCVVDSLGSAVVLDAQSGKETGKRSLPKEIVKVIGTKNFLAIGNFVAAIVGEQLYTWQFCGAATAKLLNFDLSLVRLKGKEPNNYFLPWFGTPRVFLVGNGAFTFFFKIEDDKLKPRINNAVSPMGPVKGSTDLVFCSARKDGYEMKFVDSHWGDKSSFTVSELSGKDFSNVEHTLAIGELPHTVVSCSADQVVATLGKDIRWRIHAADFAAREEL